MEKIGDILRNARLDKGMSLREAEEETKIRLRYLEALENGDYKQIPGRVYVLGFLRNYARFLGLDAQELTERFKAEFPAEEEPHIVEEFNIAKPGPAARRRFPIFLVLGVLIFFWSVNWLYKSYQPPVDPPPPPGANVGEEEQPPQEQQPPAVPEPQIEGVEVRLKANGNCWTEIIIDGSSEYSIYDTLRAGFEQVFTGDKEIYLHLGNAGAVEVIVNGQNWPSLGREGEVVTVTFTPESVPPDNVEGDLND